MLSVVADVGGTNTRLALARDGRVLTDTLRKRQNTRFADLAAVLRDYLAELAASPQAAAIAIAGPVRHGVGRLTNLNWEMDSAGLRAATGAERVMILNDLQAHGHALGHLETDMVDLITAGTGSEPGGARLVVGVGTGFNAAVAHNTPSGVQVAASECGHITLPLCPPKHGALGQALAQPDGFIGVEDALSGRGLERIYGFVGPGATMPADQIMAALAAGAPQAQTTAGLFLDLLGRVVGDLALVHLPFGGIFLCGGVARAFGGLIAPNAPNFRPEFGQGFAAKGRFSDFMTAFPIHMITDDFAALLGCAASLQAPNAPTSTRI